jgi:flagellin
MRSDIRLQKDDPMNSVNTNYGALVALQNLNKTNNELGEVQNRINTGLKVSSARDNGAIYAIAEGQRARVGALTSVKDGIDRASIVIDTAIAAGESIGTLMKEMRKKAVDAQAADLSSAQKATLQRDFDQLRAQINQVANAATFNGANLVNGSNTAVDKAYKVVTSDTGGAGGTTSSSFTMKGAAISTTDITAPTQVLDQVTGVNAGDSVKFDFGFRTTATTDDTSINVEIKAGETVDQFVNRINTATGGRVSASFDNATGRIAYTGGEEFRTSVTTASGNTTAEAFLGDNRTANATTLTAFQLTTSKAVAGEHTITGTAFTADITGSTDIVGDDTITAGDEYRFYDAGGNVLGSVIMTTTMTADAFIAAVYANTNGQVTATGSFGGAAGTDTISYSSAQEFSIESRVAAGTVVATRDVLTGSTTTGYVTATAPTETVKLSGETMDITNAATRLSANDAVKFLDSNGNQIGSDVTLAAGTTARSFSDSVFNATNGRVKAQFNDDGTFTYSSNESFSVNFVENQTSVANTTAASFLDDDHGAEVAGGGTAKFRLQGTAFTTAATGTSVLQGNDGLATNDTVTIQDAAGDVIGTVTLTATMTLNQYLAEVDAQSGGAVKANYDAVAKRINYESDAGFRLVSSNTTDATGAADGGELVGNGALGGLGVAGTWGTGSYQSTGSGSGAGSSAVSTTVSAFDFRTSAGGSLNSLANLDISTNAAAAVATIDSAQLTVTDGMAKLGSQGRALDIQKEFLQKLSDNVEKGIGALVDADLAKESARLQSLQIKQQLGAQALSIANQQPSILLSFFR